MADTSLVDRNFAWRPDCPGTAAGFHLLVLHSNQLLLLRSNLDRADFHGGDIVCINRLQFAAGLRIEARQLRLVIRVFGVAVIQHLPLGRRCGGSAAIGIHRFEFHPAIWCDAGLVRLVSWMHWIDPVENLAAAFVRGCRRASFYSLVDVAAHKRACDHNKQTDYSNRFHLNSLSP